jgi:hypothetical protein
MATPTIAMIPSGYKAGTVYSVLPVDGTGDLAFTRAGTKTRINESQAIEALATGVPSIDYTGGGCPSLLLEQQQQQLYGETATMATQTKTVTAVEHTVGFYGTGTITFTGTYAGSLVGTGINDRVELTFTPTAGSLISTVSGSVTSSQLVTGDYLGSYIPNTTTGTITRIEDTSSKTGLSSYINSTEGVVFFKGNLLVDDTSNIKSLCLSDGTSNNIIRMQTSGTSNQIYARIQTSGISILLGYILPNITETFAMAFLYKSGALELYINGSQVATDSSTFTFTNPLSVLDYSFPDGSQVFHSSTDDIRVYNQVLTGAELITLTTL